MAMQTINIGATANDHSGDGLRNAFDKANQNFSELYANISFNAGGLAVLTNWQTGKVYAKDQLVVEAGRLYRSNERHGSGVFATDLAAGKWTFVVEFPAGPPGDPSTNQSINDAPSRADAAARAIPGDAMFLRTAGYEAAGDGGAALYKRVEEEPSHEGKVQSADGAWWELAESQPNVQMFGASMSRAPAENGSAFNKAKAYCYAKNIAVCFVAPGQWIVEDTAGTEVILIDKPVVFRGESAITTGIFASSNTPRSVDLVRMAPGVDPGNPLCWGFQNISLYAIDGGRDALFIDLAPTKNLDTLVLDSCIFQGSGVSDGADKVGKALRTFKDISTGNFDGFFSTTFKENIFINGVEMVNAGDSLLMRGGKVAGKGLGIYMSSVPGAASCIFDGVNNTAEGGQFYLKSANTAEIRNCQIETPGSYTGEADAQVVLDDCVNCAVTNNSMNTVGMDIDNVLIKGSASVNNKIKGNSQVITTGRWHLLIAADAGANNRFGASGYFIIGTDVQANPSIQVLSPQQQFLPFFFDGPETGVASPSASRGRAYFKLDSGETRLAHKNSAGVERVLVGRNTTDTLTNKSLTAPIISGGTATGLTTLGIRSTAAAFDVQFGSAEAITAARQVTMHLGDADRLMSIHGNFTIASSFTTVGANAITLTSTGTTALTLPTSGTLATLAGGNFTGSITAINSTNLSGASFAARRSGSPALEFGYNLAGYCSTLGADNFGSAYFAYSCRPGPTGGRFTTENVMPGAVMIHDGAGGMQWGTVPISSTDVAPTVCMAFTSNGAFTVNGTITPKSYTVATLPAGTAGMMAYASNCRAFNGAGVQEGAGAGTGSLVSHNGTAWKIAGTNITAVA